MDRDQIDALIQQGFESGGEDAAPNLGIVDGRPFFMIWYRSSASGAYWFYGGTARWDGSTLWIEGTPAAGDPTRVPPAFYNKVAPIPQELATSFEDGGFCIIAANPEPFEEADAEDRAHRSRQFRTALAQVLDLFDPERIVDHINPGGEYEPEVDRLLPQLQPSTSVEEVRDMLLRIFDQMFGGSSSLTKGDAEQIASIVFALWRKYREQLEAIDRRAS